MNDTSANDPPVSDPQVWRRKEVDSPCVQICVMHRQEKICTGCLRTIDEITGWSKMTDDERQLVKDALPARAPLLRKRRGGRAARLQRDS